MLHEQVIATKLSLGTSRPSGKANGKDVAGWHQSSISQAAVLFAAEACNISPNCFALSDTHIFVAQADRGGIHVFDRCDNSREAVIAFPQKLRSVTITASGSVLVLGTDCGGIIVWELFTDRKVLSSRAHLGPVVDLAVDLGSNFVLSGSEDSVVHVWSIFDLISFSTQSAEQCQPRHSLTGHRQAITSVTTGHSRSHTDLAASASADGTVILWNYQSGQRLRTLPTPSSPLCVSFDVADRAIHIGLEDGSIQLISLHQISEASSRRLGMATEQLRTPNRVGSILSARTSDESLGAVLCLCPGFDSATIFTGHASGEIVQWDLGGRCLKAVVARHPASSITSLTVVGPSGLDKSGSLHRPMRGFNTPQMHEAMPHSNSKFSSRYQIACSLPAQPSASSNGSHFGHGSRYIGQLASPRFSQDLLAASFMQASAEIPGTQPTPNGRLNSFPTEPTSEFLSLDSPSGAVADELNHLRNQVAHLRKMQSLSNAHIDRLSAESAFVRKHRLARSDSATRA